MARITHKRTGKILYQDSQSIRYTVVCAIASGTSLAGARLDQIDLRHTELHSGCFDGADISASSFDDADLSSSSFISANLPDSSFDRADLSNVDFTGANLNGATFRHALLRGANLTSTEMRNADLTGAILTGATLTYADLTGADLTGADLTGVDLSRTVAEAAATSPRSTPSKRRHTPADTPAPVTPADPHAHCRYAGTCVPNLVNPSVARCTP